MPAAGAVTASSPSSLIVLALVYYLVSTILALRADHRRARRGDRAASARSWRRARRSTTSSTDINAQPRRRRRRCSRACWSRRPAWTTPSASSTASTRAPPPPGLRDFPESTDGRRRRASARSTRKGTLTLARLGREAPIAAGQPGRRRCCATSRAAASPRGCCTPRSARRGPRALPRSPVIGTDAPVQYEQRDGHRRSRASGSRQPAERSTCADPRAIRVRARDQRRGRDRVARSGSAPRRASSPAGTACCR